MKVNWATNSKALAIVGGEHTMPGIPQVWTMAESLLVLSSVTMTRQPRAMGHVTGPSLRWTFAPGVRLTREFTVNKSSYRRINILP
jgi:hypothetical protein